MSILMRKNKEVDIRARVTRKMRSEVESLAYQRGEAVSLIVREAIGEYLTKRKNKAKTPNSQ
jgi:hypothetical protein